MDFLNSLRSMVNLFAPIQKPGAPDITSPDLSHNMPGYPLVMNMNQRAFDTPPDISQVGIGPIDPYERLRQLYQPEHKYIDQADELLNQLPQRQKPSTGQKIAGSIYGLAHSPKEVDDMIYGNYNRQLQDWKMRFDPLMQLANQERYGNAQDRSFATSVLQNEAADKRLNETIRKNDMTNAINQQKVNIASRRAQSYEELNKWRMDHPNYTPFAQPDGNVILFDRNSGDALDTGISSGKYDEKELINLRGKIQSGLISQRGKIASGLEDQRQGNRESLEATRQKNRSQLITERAAARGSTVAKDKQLSVSQDAAAWKLARQQYIADNPSHAIFWDSVTGLPTDDAEDDDTGTYERAVDDMRARYNRIKQRATGTKGPIKDGKPAGSVVPTKANDGTKDVYAEALARSKAGLSLSKEQQTALNKGGQDYLRSKAMIYLREHNLPLTPANIEHAIKTGRVK